MADYTDLGIVSPEWTTIEEGHPEFFKPPPADWSVQQIKDAINERRAKQAAEEPGKYREFQTPREHWTVLILTSEHKRYNNLDPHHRSLLY
jgi:hypothetical protein